MAKELDVYRDWLGITETARPLSHYQLLRLDLFEDDPAKIRGNYRKMNAHVRKYAAGEYGAQSQELLNELAKAMLCLTDNLRKAEYDASLGRQTAAGGQKGRGRTRSKSCWSAARCSTRPSSIKLGDTHARLASKSAMRSCSRNSRRPMR